MWREREREIESRRARLQERSRSLRVRLGEQARVLQRPLAVADGVRHRLQWLGAHPHWLAAAAAVALPPLLLRPRRALAWALKLWWGWRAWQRLRPFLPR